MLKVMLNETGTGAAQQLSPAQQAAAQRTPSGVFSAAESARADSAAA